MHLHKTCVLKYLSGSHCSGKGFHSTTRAFHSAVWSSGGAGCGPRRAAGNSFSSFRSAAIELPSSDSPVKSRVSINDNSELSYSTDFSIYSCSAKYSKTLNFIIFSLELGDFCVIFTKKKEEACVQGLTLNFYLRKTFSTLGTKIIIIIFVVY